ncbi:MAG: amidohydrolase [Desulfobacteraceae bacterium]|nr:MAG: amidohydrolase [Desulfobacteraceae bacterium]
MIIDFHTHIFPEDICQNREKYFHQEPAFKLLYDSPKSKLVPAETILNAMDNHRIDISVVFGFPWKNRKTSQFCNDYILDVVSRYPNRFKGFCCFDPATENAGKETERCIQAGLSGVGELAFYQSGIDRTMLDQLQPVMEICREKNLPVLIHTNEPVGHQYPGKTPNTLSQIYEIPRTFPDNTIVLAHWGGGIFFYHLLKKETRDVLQNVYYDTAASPFLYNPEIYPLSCRLAGSEKILFGSDFPLLSPARYFTELDMAGIDPETKNNILGNNAARLLNIRLDGDKI